MALTEEQKNVIRESAEDKKLSCAKAFQLSNELNLSLREIGKFCDEDGIKLARCQLGAF